jgi:uncharacterized protein YodC (DUF2158 family)
VTEEGIQIGDRVSLRSGGPVMSVQARSQNLAYCAWKNDGRLYYGTFDVGSLHRVTESQDAGARGSDEGLPCA